MTKKILLVGEHLNTEDWRQDFEARGYSCDEAENMMQAIDFLKAASEKPALLVQSNLPICSVDDLKRTDVPAEFKRVDQYARGAALIQHARSQRLIPDEMPAYLATLDAQDHPVLPTGVTKVVNWGSETPLPDQISPPHHRGSNGTGRRFKR